MWVLFVDQQIEENARFFSNKSTVEDIREVFPHEYA
jgi:hypothetical protein